MVNDTSTQRQTPNADSCPKSDDVIHVAMCIYDPSGTYSQHAGVVMTSIFENTHSKVTVHILHDDTLTDNNRRKFLRTAEKYSQRVEFHDVTEYRDRIGEKVTNLLSGGVTVGTLYKLLIPDMVQADKVIYLDSDIIVNLDIVELWNVNMENYPIAGVHDVTAVGAFMFVRDWLIGCNSRKYINAGVMLMNLALIRRKGSIFNGCAEWIDKHAHIDHVVSFGDQDIINTVFYESIKLINRKFDNIPLEDNIIADSIIHTAGGSKGWEMTGKIYQPLYWKMYLRSAWGENDTPEEVIDAIASRVKQTRKEPKISIIRSIVRRIKRTVPIVITRLILRDIFFRIKYRLRRN